MSGWGREKVLFYFTLGRADLISQDFTTHLTYYIESTWIYISIYKKIMKSPSTNENT